MGAWAYYSPLGLGLLVTLVLHETVRAHAPAMPAWAEWPFVVGVALVVGLLCQLMMIGVQGAFAQVLPVPIGRSIRGRAAEVGGCLIMGCVALAVVAVLLGVDELNLAALVVGVLSGVSGAGALITYIWCWPTALRDFDKRSV
jgi:hypothetical protein